MSVLVLGRTTFIAGSWPAPYKCVDPLGYIIEIAPYSDGLYGYEIWDGDSLVATCRGFDTAIEAREDADEVVHALCTEEGHG